MTRKEALEENIRQSYQLIREYEDIQRLSADPKEKARARRAIEEQWALIQGYLDEYLPICQQRGALLPTDIAEIATRFRINIVGDGNVVGNHSSSHVSKGSTPATTSPSNDWNTAAIRDLLSAAFSDDELTTLCFDHFPTLYEEFGTGMSKRQKIQLLLAHCVRRDRLDDLVRLVKEMNPAQYRRFAGRLKK